MAPYTIGNYLWTERTDQKPVTADHPEVKKALAEVEERTQRFLSINGKRSPDSFHRELGKLMWEKCGMARNEAGLKEAQARIPALRAEFWENLRVPGSGADLNQSLEKAGRVADFLELAELFATDALHRRESCGGHFREESQTPEGEALRDDDSFRYVAAWEFNGVGKAPVLHKEDLEFEHVKLTQRSYK